MEKLSELLRATQEISHRATKLRSLNILCVFLRKPDRRFYPTGEQVSGCPSQMAPSTRSSPFHPTSNLHLFQLQGALLSQFVPRRGEEKKSCHLAAGWQQLTFP